MINGLRDLEGRTALVTGGSSGIGRGIVEELLIAGMKVLFTYRTEEHASSALQELDQYRDRVLAFRLDVRSRGDMELAVNAAVNHFGPIHLFVNNAGIALHNPVKDVTEQEWRLTFEVNVDSVFHGVQAALPHMLGHGEPSAIVSTSSVMGLIGAGGRSFSYTASKFAVVGMMEALGAELRETNVRTAVFCPGLVRSKMWDMDRLFAGSAPPGIRCMSDAEREASSAIRNNLEIAMTEREAGSHFVRGLSAGNFFILSHSEYREILSDRCEAMLNACPAEGAGEERIRLARQTRGSTAYPPAT